VTSLLLLRVATRPFESLAAFHGRGSAAAAAEMAASERALGVTRAGLEAALHTAAGPASPEADAASVRARLAVLALRRDVHNDRAPVLADLDVAGPLLDAGLVAALGAIHGARARRDRAAAAWEAALANDLAASRAALLAAAGDPLVREGIALGSRSLAGKLRALAAAGSGSWGHGDRHIAAKALRYVARFATKTSPNGVFCATALACATGEACRAEGSPAIARRDLILSVAEARKVACALAFDPAVEAAVVPRPNPTLREEDGGLTFWTFASARNPNDDEKLSRVKDHPVLRMALEEAEPRTLTLPGLRARVASRAGVSEDDLAPFLRQMIERGVLVAEIEIPYNERRPVRFVAARARAAGCSAAWIDRALAIERGVDALAALEQGARPAAMGRLARELSALPRARELREDELYRLDARSETAVRLPARVVADLDAGLGPYLRLFAALYPARRSLQGWVNRFLSRFPADEDVELLDVYRAITEQGETYRPAAFPEPASGREGDAARAAMTAVRGFIVERARATPPGGEITFDEARLEALVPHAPRPRWACGVLFQIAAKDAAAVERGEHRLVLNGLFHGAGLSLSRFAHLLGEGRPDADNPVVRELARAWSVIERPGALVAELTYNHLGRTANAGLRPAIFSHEIELPGDTASPGATVLGLRDLRLRWDTAEDRFVMRWPAGGSEVIPVINSGVNPVGFVSLLVAIGEQGLQPVGYFPGFDDPGVVRWPRVVSGRVVLFRERWTFRRDGWPSPPVRGDDPVGFARAVVGWRDRHGLPRHVFVHTSKEPKPRYVDLEAPLFLDLLRRDLVVLEGDPEGALHVTEMLPGPGDLWVGGPGGRHATEFLVQMSG
jgi:Lantibiotic dehydratase, N terminus